MLSIKESCDKKAIIKNLNKNNILVSVTDREKKGKLVSQLLDIEIKAGHSIVLMNDGEIFDNFSQYQNVLPIKTIDFTYEYGNPSSDYFNFGCLFTEDKIKENIEIFGLCFSELVDTPSYNAAFLELLKGGLLVAINKNPNNIIDFLLTFYKNPLLVIEETIDNFAEKSKLKEYQLKKLKHMYDWEKEEVQCIAIETIRRLKALASLSMPALQTSCDIEKISKEKSLWVINYDSRIPESLAIAIFFCRLLLTKIKWIPNKNNIIRIMGNINTIVYKEIPKWYITNKDNLLLTVYSNFIVSLYNGVNYPTKITTSKEKITNEKLPNTNVDGYITTENNIWKCQKGKILLEKKGKV